VVSSDDFFKPELLFNTARIRQHTVVACVFMHLFQTGGQVGRALSACANGLNLSGRSLAVESLVGSIAVTVPLRLRSSQILLSHEASTASCSYVANDCAFNNFAGSSLIA